jgi:hypothetical protein
MAAVTAASASKARALAAAKGMALQMARNSVPVPVAIARIAAFLAANGFGSQSYSVARLLVEDAYQPAQNIFERITGTEFSGLVKITGPPGKEKLVTQGAAWAQGWKGLVLRLGIGAGGVLVAGLGATMLATGEGIDRAAERFAKALRSR